VGVAAARRLSIARALIWITPLLWSSNYIVARLCHGVIAPHVLALGRWTLALALMLPFAWRGLARNGAPWRREWRQLLVLGGLGMWICGAFVYIGGETTSAVNIGLFYAATPALIAVAVSRHQGEALTPAQVAGLLLAWVGVIFIIAKGHFGNLLGVRLTHGDLWIVAAALGWAAYSVLLRVWPSVLGPAERLVVITAGGVIVLLPFTALELALIDAPPFSLAAVGLIVLAALLPGVLSYQAYSFMQRELGATRAAVVLYLGPLYSAFSAWVVLGEPPAWYHGAGALLILPSIWLATRIAPIRVQA
jgi:drug/metabolite transporter (DMT)-like permease